MGISVSILLIAVGAILTWAVTAEAEGIDINTVGVILMIVGLLGLVVSLHVLVELGRVPTRRLHRRRPCAPRVDRAAATTVVEEDEVGPGPPPP